MENGFFEPRVKGCMLDFRSLTCAPRVCYHLTLSRVAGGGRRHTVSSCHAEQFGKPTSKETRAVGLDPVQEEDKGTFVLALPKGECLGTGSVTENLPRRKASLKPDSG